MSELQPKYRKDYRPLDFKITHTNLLVQLDVPHTRVVSTLKFVRQNPQATSFTLDGQKLTLESVKVNGVFFTNYELVELPGSQGFQSLKLDVSSLSNQDEFTVEIANTFDLENNKTLMGIYKSDDIICSQCEAEGFRQITFYLDRPDNLAVFTVRIEASQEIPYLLSNGNPVGKGELPYGRHYAEWHDPFPKPCYLFALCAGNFDCIEDEFVTMSGRKVDLKIYCEVGKKDGLYFAMESLKRSMKWDEERFGLEYDLDLFMIVAVSFFNMGAMENKGLNIFNESCLIGNKDFSSDDVLIHAIDRVVAHEYFHNWTGDRVTCRDWFQLTLKEGLTVFRDQEYTGDTYGQTEKRVQDAQIVKIAQFAEDAGPMSHPIRPEKVLSQDNFYTVTVYEKGAEVIRMIHTLLGEEGFQAGMRLYFQRHDGDAVTCDDFVQAMQDASGVDLTEFKRWYSQSGTPRVKVLTSHDPATQTYTVTFEQYTPPTNDQKEKQPLQLLLKTHLLDRDSGARLTNLTDSDGNLFPELVVFSTDKVTYTLQGVAKEPLLITNLDFSSPVIVEKDYNFDELVFITKNADNLYARYEAYNQVLHKQFAASMEALAKDQEPEYVPQLVELYDYVLDQAQEHPKFVADFLGRFYAKVAATFTKNLDPILLQKALDHYETFLSDKFEAKLKAIYQAQAPGAYEFNMAAVHQRELRNATLVLLNKSGKYNDLARAQYFNADNYTAREGAMIAMLGNGHYDQEMVTDFEERFAKHATTLDNLTALRVAGVKSLDELKAIVATIDLSNPNRCYPVIRNFVRAAKVCYSLDGSGLEYVRELLETTDKLNPHLGAVFARFLTRFGHLAPAYQTLIVDQLEILASKKDSLSNNVNEIVANSLEFTKSLVK